MASFPETAFWLTLAYASGLKLARVKAIVAAWCLEGGQPLAALFELTPASMAAQLGIPREEGEQVAAAARRVSEHAEWLAHLEREGTQLTTRADPRYPRALVRWLPPAMQPLLLFYRGNFAMLSRPSAAVIGARDAGAEAVSLARELATFLAEEGLAVVSGLDRGVGKFALDAALSAEGGQAIGVLPMGINAFRGVAHTLEQVSSPLERGQMLLLSPFHPEAKFSEAQALARNKLIVGLAGAVFVVAAGEKDVTRATAVEALGLGKTVCVWDVAPSSEPAAAGNQALMQAGALPIGGLPDILDAVEAIVATALELMEATEAPVTAPPPLTAQVKETEEPYDSQAVLHLLSEAGRVPEALARRLREDSGD